MNVEGKTIKEFVQGISYCYIIFTDGTSVDLDIKGDAYIEYSYSEQVNTGGLNLRNAPDSTEPHNEVEAVKES